MICFIEFELVTKYYDACVLLFKPDIFKHHEITWDAGRYFHQ